MTRWHLALASASALLLGACTGPATRSPPQPVPERPPAVAAPVEVPPAAPSVPPPVTAASPWSRLRSRFAMPDCDYRPEVLSEAYRYTRAPHIFERNWQQAMPFLLLVVDEIERRDLPGEFALLPYVESTYRPVPPRSNKPAGMWQLAPRTARGEGLQVSADYDARLDALAATTAALDLLAGYYRQFADWRVADMAFNSGEFRVKKALGERDASMLSATDIAKMGLSSTTRTHVARLLALACIIDSPERFGVRLPEPEEEDRLVAIDLEAPIDLRVAARMAGLEIDDLTYWNAAYRHNRMAFDAPHRLLMPAGGVERFDSNAAQIPTPLWNDWREQRASRTRSVSSWATQVNVPVAVLATANGIEPDAAILPSTTLLLPEHAASATKSPTTASKSSHAGGARSHTIVAGDTLSAIAHHYAIPLHRLQSLNPQANGTLQIGQSLMLKADPP